MHYKLLKENVSESESAESLYFKGRRCCDWESWDFGIEFYTKALEIKPDYIDALFWRAQAYQFRNEAERDYEKAIADYTTLLEFDAGNDEARSYLAYAHYQNGENDKAIALWEKVLQTNPHIALELMPDEFKNMDMCLEAVKKEADSLEYVPEEFKTAEMCLEAVKQDSDMLEYVPEKFKTSEFCLEVVKQNGCALYFVPESLKTAELCMEAVKQDYLAYKFVPKTLDTDELCIMVREKDKHCSLFARMPKRFKTAEYCLEAVKNDGYAIKYVPEKFKTVELCFEAFKKNHYALKFVPQNLKDEVQEVINKWKEEFFMKIKSERRGK